MFEVYHHFLPTLFLASYYFFFVYIALHFICEWLFLVILGSPRIFLLNFVFIAIWIFSQKYFFLVFFLVTRIQFLSFCNSLLSTLFNPVSSLCAFSLGLPDVSNFRIQLQFKLKLSESKALVLGLDWWQNVRF